MHTNISNLMQNNIAELTVNLDTKNVFPSINSIIRPKKEKEKKRNEI